MSGESLPVVVVDDEPGARMIISKILSERGYSVRGFPNAEDAIGFFREHPSRAVVFLDIFLPGMDGVSALPKLLEINPTLSVVMMTAYQTVDSVIRAMKLGAVDFLVKPLNPEIVLQAVQKYGESGFPGSLQVPDAASKPSAPGKSKPLEFQAFTPAMKSVLSAAEKFASSGETVLILGESGTGKELLANYIHSKSARSKKAFGVVDCASIPESLFESELFGYEKGAFTGAETFKAGRFELADGGSLFLDEIGNVPLSMQAKLLRFTEDRMVSRLGGKKTFPLDIRLIAATNADLRNLVNKGSFREDLYYRLSALTVHLPPLRNRTKEEKELLVGHLLDVHARKLNKPPAVISEAARELIFNYPWPGNVRELEHALYSATLLCGEGPIEIQNLPLGIQSYASRKNYVPMSSEDGDKTLREILKKVEKEQILSAIAQTGGNKKKASDILKIDYKNFLKKLKEYGWDG